MHIQIDPHQRYLLERIFAAGPILTLDAGDETVVTVRQAAGWTRITPKGDSFVGRDIVVLREPDGAVTLLDPPATTYFRADATQTAPWRRMTLGDAVLERSEGQLADGRTATVATLTVHGVTPVQLRIWFIGDEALQPFARGLLCTLVGCPDDLRHEGTAFDEFLELGAPVRTETYLLGRDGAGNGTPAVIGTLEDLHAIEIGDDDFRVPSGWDDLRDTDRMRERVGTEGRPIGPPRRLSTLRPGAPASYGRVRTKDGVGRFVAGRIDDFVTEREGGTAAPRTPGAERTDDVNVPQCLPATLTSVLGLTVEQQLLDDIRAMVNAVSRRLSAFSGKAVGGGKGEIDFNWLEQWSNSPAAADNQDGLFCLLVRPNQPDPATPFGLLFRLAERQVRRALADGTLTTQLQLPPGLLAAVVGVSGSDPARRFDRLSPAVQRDLRDRYLRERLGRFRLEYSSSTSPQQTFFDLVNVQLNALEWDISIDRQAILANLDTTSAGLALRFTLPKVRATADMGRWPTARYYAVLAASGIACGLVPLLCSLATAVVNVGLFLLSDYSYLRVKLDDVAVDAEIGLLAAPGGQQPKVTKLVLDANINVFYMSMIPTGLHQLVSFVYSLVGTHTKLVLDEIESQLTDKLDDLFKDTLALRFPPPIGPFPANPYYGGARGAPRDFVFLESAIGTAGFPSAPPYMTQVERNIFDRLMAERNRFTFGRKYAGFALSQNFLNMFINARWRQGAFTYGLGAAEIDQVVRDLRGALGFTLTPPVNMVIWPATSPRLVLTPRGERDGQGYATTFFDDLRLCVQYERSAYSILELQFAAQVDTQIGLGGLDPATQQLDLGRFGDGFMDLYFDLDGRGPRLIHPEMQHVIGIGPRFSGVGLDALPALEPVCLRVLTMALASRSDRAIPAEPGDRYFHRYAMPGSTLDVHLFPARGILYGWLGLTGVQIPGLPGLPNGLLDLLPGGKFDITADPADETFECSFAETILNQS